ncbi:MAG: WecB/TagA/CpsF family glycosyltransferase [Patescibacteria group bacterium]|jgi:N-acetylglucosaminyldiphosphoundecaprenol N-acetyl-beta-D-mannosaminyltransferase
MTLRILDVRVDTVTQHTIDDYIHRFLREKKLHHIVTVNPEIVMYAQTDNAYARILDEASLCVPDGIGLVYAARHSGTRIKRLTGYDLLTHLMHVAEHEQVPVFFLGGGQDVAHAAALRIKKKFPGLRVVGAEEGLRHPHEGVPDTSDDEQHKYLIEHLNLVQPKILLVAFGHPKQEKWIYEYASKIPSVHIAVGVGGLFDYISGKVRRAPWIFRAAGLEWLFRLVRQPWRLPRIGVATFKFVRQITKKRKTQ